MERWMQQLKETYTNMLKQKLVEMQGGTPLPQQGDPAAGIKNEINRLRQQEERKEAQEKTRISKNWEKATVNATSAEDVASFLINKKIPNRLTSPQVPVKEEAALDGPNSNPTPELPQETIKELVRQGWKHPVHNPPRPSGASSGGWGNRGYFIDEPHPEHKGWYVTKGPYSGD